MFYADELTNTKNTTTVIINSAPDVPHAMLSPYLPPPYPPFLLRSFPHAMLFPYLSAHLPTSFSSLPSPSPFCRYLPISISV